MRRGSVALAVVLLMIAALMLAINPILNKIVLPSLVDSINSRSGVKLSVGAFEYSFFSNTLSVRNAELIVTDPSPGRRDTMRIQSRSASFAGVGWPGILLGREISCSEVRVTHPAIRVVHDDLRSDDTTSPGDNDRAANTLRRTISEWIPERTVNIGLLSVDSAAFTGEYIEKGDTTSDSAAALTATIAGIRLSRDDTDKFFNSYEIRVEHFQRRLRTSCYDLAFRNLFAGSAPCSLAVDSLSLRPFVTDEYFFEKRGYRDDRWILRIPHLVADNMNLAEVLTEERISADRVTLDSVYAECFTNKRLPLRPSSDPKMPNEILQSGSMVLDIQEGRVRNSRIVLESLVPNVPRRARLVFADIHADIFRLTNTRLTNAPKDTCVIVASALLMDEGRLRVRLVYPLLTQNLSFFYTGSLGMMRAGAINPHLEVEDQTSISSGMIDSISFRGDVRRGIAVVNIEPVYHNLKIVTLDERGSSKNFVASFIANTFVIRGSNPAEDGTRETGTVTYARKSGDAFLDVIWLGLLRGLGSVVGF